MRSALGPAGPIIVLESDSDFLMQGIPASQDEIWRFNNPVPVELMSFTIE